MGGKHADPRPTGARRVATSGAVSLGLALGGTTALATTAGAAPAPTTRIAGTVGAASTALAPSVTVNGYAIDPLLYGTWLKQKATLGNPISKSVDYGAGRHQMFQYGGLFSRTRTAGTAVYKVSGWEWATWKNARGEGMGMGAPTGNVTWISGTGNVQHFAAGVTVYNSAGPRMFVAGRSWVVVARAGGIGVTGYPRNNATSDGYNKVQRFSRGGASVYALGSTTQTWLYPVLVRRTDSLGGTKNLGRLTNPMWSGRCGIFWVAFSRSGSISARTDNRWCPKTTFAQPTATMVKPPSGYDISTGWGMGKVNAVTKALGLPWQYDNYGWTESTAVKNFQARKGLPVTGVVNKTTWDAMGTGWSWWIDGWQTNVVSSTKASREQHVEQMIAFAQSQVGAKYIFGGTGPASLGYACSGIVYQSLISAGVDPYPMTWVHTAAPNSWGNQAIYRNWTRWQHVPVGQAKRGDLVFWDVNQDGFTEHIGIYLGGGKVLDSIYVKGYRYGVNYTTLQQKYFGMPLAPYAVRPFADNVA